MRKATWDTALGRQMWEEGKKDAEIADAFGIPTGTVTSYRLKHWDQTNVPKKKPFTLEGMQPVAVDDADDTPAEPEADSPATQENEILRVPVPETHAPAEGRQHAFRSPKRMLPPKGGSMMIHCLRRKLRSWMCLQLLQSTCPASGRSAQPVRSSPYGFGGTRKIFCVPVTPSTTC